MAGSVRRIRRIEISKVADFDDQLWPINCAILILAGFVAGIVVATSDFAEPRLLYNGWARLASVGLMVGLAFWGVVWLQGKMVRRLQLCVLISLLAHLWLAMYLHEQYLALLAQREAGAAHRAMQQYEPITVPDYYWQQIDEPESRQSFEEPIETEIPKPAEPEALKQESSEPEMPTEVSSPEEPEVPQRQQPNPSVRRRAELSAPRRADAAAGAQISRQEWKHRPRPDEPIPEPAIQLPPRRTAALPSPNIAPRDPQRTEVRVDQREAFEEPSSTRAEPVELAVARRASRPETLPDVPTTSGPTKHRPRPAEIPRVDAAAPEPVQPAQRAQDVDPKPPQGMAARRQANAPSMLRSTLEITVAPSMSQAVIRAAARQRRPERTGRFARAGRAAPARRTQGRLQITTTEIARATVTAPAASSVQPDLPTAAPMTAASHTGDGSAHAPQDQPAGRALPAMTRAAQLPTAVARRRGVSQQRREERRERSDFVPLAARSSLLPSPSSLLASSAAIGRGEKREERRERSDFVPLAARSSLLAPPSSSAAVRRLAAEPTLGSSAAAAGTADFVIGSAQLVARMGQPRGNAPGPSPAAKVGRGPLRNREVPGLLRGVAEAIEQQPIAAAAPSTPGDAMEAVEGAVVGEPDRREGGLPVQIAAVAGPGGLGYDPLPEVGLPSRRARPESKIVHTILRRFVIERSGGQLAIDAGAKGGRIRPQPADAFRQRDVGRRSQVAQARGGSQRTEKAVEMGLDFFARHQFPDGHWSLHKLPRGLQYEDPALGRMESDTAATGLALLAYLGAGYTHLDDKHRAVVRRGIDWLAGSQRPDGDLFVGGTKYARFYSHGIAAIALCEAYGMTRDPELREPARKAVEFIVKTQHPTRGGWRYDLDEKGTATETDTSVTGWQLMALRSAQMAGLEVPQPVLEKIDDWLKTAQVPSLRGHYVYNPFAGNTAEQRRGRRPNLAMTSEGMLMRMYLGHGRDDAQLVAGADHLAANLPQLGTERRPLRDCYYWYYATQAMFHMRDDHWIAWNDRLRPLLASSQVQFGEAAGSWHPGRPVPDRWGHAGGRHYVTALHLLMLEVYYRHLPLFEELGR